LSFEILPARLKDLIPLNRLEKRVFKEDAWPVVELFTLLVFPGTIHLKAEDGERMIGFISAEENWFDRSSSITNVGVDPEYRRQGVATALMKKIESLFKRKIIRLSVRVSNHDAIHLYQTLGYKIIKTRQRYYSDGEDAFEMEKSR
jgi:[ribosomal protein S18]-alanine N-acetyltransferase